MINHYYHYYHPIKVSTVDSTASAAGKNALDLESRGVPRTEAPQ